MSGPAGVSPGPVPSAPEGDEADRVTEIGPPEPLEVGDHPVATGVGVVALLLLVVLGVVALAGLMTPETSDDQVAQIVVPRVTARSLDQAQLQLERLGLIVDVQYAPNEVAPVDVVVDQEPIAGARLEVGEQVELVVSDGPAGLRVPDFGEVSAAEAARLLGAIGLVASVEEVFDEEVPQGELIGSIPAEGARVVPGTRIRVQVSKGPEPRTVPQVVGLPSAEGFAAIGQAELEVGDVRRRVVRGATPGTIVSVDPEGGSTVPRGLPLEIVVAIEPDSVLLVPELVGFTRASADGIAAASGLDLVVRTQAVPPGDRRAGRVISQSPVATSPIEPGSTVTITVGLAPPPPTTTTTVPGGGSPPTTAPAPGD